MGSAGPKPSGSTSTSRSVGQRCGYCAFATYTDRDHLMVRYVDACVAEIHRAQTPGPCPRPPACSSGGGTPSRLAAAELCRILGALELRAGSRGHRRVQSRGRRRRTPGRLPPGRGHPPLLRRPVHRAPRAGRPGPPPRPVDGGPGRLGGLGGRLRHLQRRPDLRGDRGIRRRLGALAALGPRARAPAAPRERLRPHRRAGDPAGRRPVTPPRRRRPGPALRAGRRAAAAAGYRWEEVSNWARPGHGCRHNRLYWAQGDYLGIGSAAHSHRRGRRWWNVRTPERYVAAVEAGRSPVAGDECGDRRAPPVRGPGPGPADPPGGPGRRPGAPHPSSTAWSSGAAGGRCSPAGAGSWPTR